MGRIGLVSLLMVFAAACGTVRSGAGADDATGTATPGATGTPTPGTDPTGGYDPGPVPTTIGGMAAFARTRDQQAGDSVGINDFIGMVNFFPVPVPVPPTLAVGWNDFPDMAMDTCEQIYPSSVGLSTSIAPPSAGVMTLLGPAGDTAMTLNMLQGVGMYLSIWNNPDSFVPMSHYVLHAPGAQIGAFDVPLFSPGEIKTLDPDITTPSPFPVSRSQPFLMKWTSVPDGRPIYIFMVQQDNPEFTEMDWMCKVTDDGEFAIPQTMLQSFGPTVTPFPGEKWRDKLQLRRWHYSTFTPPNAAGPILTSFESGWYSDIELQ